MANRTKPSAKRRQPDYSKATRCTQEGCAAVIYGPLPKVWLRKGKDLLCPQDAAKAVWFAPERDNARLFVPTGKTMPEWLTGSGPDPTEDGRNADLGEEPRACLDMNWNASPDADPMTADEPVLSMDRSQVVRDIERERFKGFDDDEPTLGGS